MIMDYWHFWHTKPILDCWEHQLSKYLLHSVPQFAQLKETEREDWIINNICRGDKSAIMITEFKNSYTAFSMLHDDPNPIPEYIDGQQVLVIGTDAFRFYEKIDGHHCMLECDVCPDLILPKNITYIMPRALSQQKKLQTVALPDSLIGIGGACFSYSGLREVTLPDSVEYISDHMFFSCYNLQKVNLGNHVTLIKSGAFEKCAALSGLRFPPSLKEIEDRAFFDSGIEIMLLPQGLQTIGKETFANCKKLHSCFIPSSVTSIGDNAFKDTSPDLILLVPKNSYAHSWAALNGYRFSTLEL